MKAGFIVRDSSGDVIIDTSTHTRKIVWRYRMDLTNISSPFKGEIKIPTRVAPPNSNPFVVGLDSYGSQPLGGVDVVNRNGAYYITWIFAVTMFYPNLGPHPKLLKDQWWEFFVYV